MLINNPGDLQNNEPKKGTWTVLRNLENVQNNHIINQLSQQSPEHGDLQTFNIL